MSVRHCGIFSWDLRLGSPETWRVACRKFIGECAWQLHPRKGGVRNWAEREGDIDPQGGLEQSWLLRAVSSWGKGTRPMLCLLRSSLIIQTLGKGCLKRVWILGEVAPLITGHLPKTILAVSYQLSILPVAGLLRSLFWRGIMVTWPQHSLWLPGPVGCRACNDYITAIIINDQN